MRQLIEKTISELGLYSYEAVELILGTCAQESAFGKYRKQIGGGPALGIFQMEPNTFNDIIENFLKYKPKLMAKIIEISNVLKLSASELVENDVLAICMCRIQYYRVKETIPLNLEGWAAYWKKHYNTPLGKGTEQEFINNFKKYVV